MRERIVLTIGTANAGSAAQAAEVPSQPRVEWAGRTRRGGARHSDRDARNVAPRRLERSMPSSEMKVLQFDRSRQEVHRDKVGSHAFPKDDGAKPPPTSGSP